MSQLEEFLDFLYGKDNGYVYVPIKLKDDPNPKTNWKQQFFQWPIGKRQVIDWIKTSTMEADVYISPILWSQKKISKQTVKKTNVAWVEFDGKLPDSYKNVPEPSMVLQSSTPLNQHVYWKLRESFAPDVVEDINHRLAYYLEADTSGWDITQVLRPPETTNWGINKGRSPLPVELLNRNEKTYRVGSFDRAPLVPKIEVNVSYDSLLQAKDIVKDKKLDAVLAHRILNDLPSLSFDRSQFIMHTAHLCAEAGLNHIEILSCLYEVDHRIKKFVGRQDQLLRLSECAAIALAKLERSHVVDVYSPLEIINHEDSHIYYLDEGWLHSTGMMIIGSAPGIGKTQLGSQILYCLSTGTGLFNKVPYKPVETLFISLEMDVISLKYIFENQAKDFQKTDLWNQNAKAIYLNEDYTVYITALVEKLRPKVILVDSLSELLDSVSEEKDAHKLLRYFQQLRDKYELAVIFIHHIRKPEGSKTTRKPKSIHDLAGSYKFGQKADTVMMLWQDEDKPDSPIETYLVKVRYARKQQFKIERSPNLTFSLAKDITVDLPNETGTTGRNPLLFS